MTSQHWRERAIQLLVLSAFAVAQPLFDLLGKQAAFFVAHRSSAAAIVLFAALLLIGPPALLLGLVRAASALSARAGEWVHRACVGTLVGVTIAPPVARALHLQPATWAAVALAAAAAAAWLHRRWDYRGGSFSWALVPPAVFAVVFLLGSPVRNLVIMPPDNGTRAIVRSPAPVLMLVLDELPLDALLRPDGSIDATRFPGFARLAAASTWYPNATTNADGTVYALPALLTGQWLREEALPTAQAFPQNLLTVVGRRYPTWASEFVTALCAADVCRQSGPVPGLPALLRDTAIVYLHATLPSTLAVRWLPPISNRWTGFTDGNDETGAFTIEAALDAAAAGANEPARFDQLLASLEPSTSTRLWYLHLGMPHVPWQALPDGRTYHGAVIGGLGQDERWSPDEAAVAHGLQRFLMQLRAVDGMVGRLLDRLHETRLDERALVVVVSDHGASFRPGAARRDFDPSAPADVLPIPLFVRYPGQATGRVDDRLAELVDVVPTIADVLDMPLSWQVDGQSLRAAGGTRAQRHVFTRLSGLTTLAADVPGRLALSSRIDALFGEGGDQDDLFRMGPHRDLVGQNPAGAADTGVPPGIDVTFEAEESITHADPGSPVVPALVSARVSGPIAAGTPIAATLNGTIAGVGWIQAAPEGGRVMSMLAPRFLRPGANVVVLYRIEPTGRLTRLSDARRGTVRLVASSDGAVITHIVRPDGRTVPVMTEDLRGHVDRLTRNGSTVNIIGYALDATHVRTPELFVITQRGRVLTTSLPWPRADVARYFDSPALVHSGLQVSTTVESPDDIDVFALFADRAYRMPLLTRP